MIFFSFWHFNLHFPEIGWSASGTSHIETAEPPDLPSTPVGLARGPLNGIHIADEQERTHTLSTLASSRRLSPYVPRDPARQAIRARQHTLDRRSARAPGAGPRGGSVWGEAGRSPAVWLRAGPPAPRPCAPGPGLRPPEPFRK